MATDPIIPQGPNTPDPGLSSKMNDLGDKVSVTEQLLAKMEEHLARAGVRSDELGKKFKNVNLELKTAVELASNTEEAVKEIANAAKSLRKGIMDTKSAKDALATVTAIRNAQEKLLEKTKAMPAAQAKVKRQMQEMDMWMQKLSKTTGNLADDEMVKLQKALHEIGKEGENVSRIFKGIQVSHLTRQITGITGAMKSFGVGKGYAAKVEKYSGYGEAAAKLREAQKARFEGNKEMFKDKREVALKAVKDKYGNDMSDPKVQARAGKSVAKALGVSTKGMSQADLIALAGGKATTRSEAIEGRYHGTGTTGVASKLATATEGGLASIGEYMAAFAPALAAVEGAIGLLVMAFDGWVAQNKAMEAGLAKGGLFSTGMGGRGFTGARAGLTPGDAYTRLGLSFDRNLKIAQAITEQGYGIQDIVNSGQQEEITGRKITGQAGEGFMAGGSGMIQRAVVGAGRLAGMTDAEGVTRLIKLMEEYHETLQGGENFFIQVSKGAKAAGLSTTKYISIIDEVLGQFDSMNRSLDSVVAVMGALSKSGRMAGDDLQKYFKFLTGGMGAQSEAGTAEQIFLLKNMSRGGRGDIAKNQADMMQNLVNRATGKGGTPAELGGIPGLTTDQIAKGFGGTAEDMTAFISNKVQPGINEVAKTDPTRAKAMNNLVEQMREAKQQSQLWGDFSKGNIDAVGLGQGLKMQGMDLQSSVGIQQAALGFILRAGSIEEFRKLGPGGFGAKHKETAFLADMFKNNPLMLKSIQQTQEVAAQARLTQVQAEPTGGPEMKKLYNDMRKKGYFKGNFAEFEKNVKEHGNDFLNNIANLESTTGFWGKASVQQQADATETERQAHLEEAKKVGAQTQTMADTIANAFSKWFNNIIEGLEAIVDLMPGGDKAANARRKGEAADYLGPNGTLAKNTQDALETLQDSIDYQTAQADAANMKGDTGKEKTFRQNASILQDQYNRVTGMQQGQSFYNDDQEKEFMAFLKQNSGGQRAIIAAKMAAMLAVPAAAAAAAAASTGGTTNINSTHYSSETTQTHAVPANAATSKESQVATVKPKLMGANAPDIGQ